jgi:hypothetical protein
MKLFSKDIYIKCSYILINLIKSLTALNNYSESIQKYVAEKMCKFNNYISTENN